MEAFHGGLKPNLFDNWANTSLQLNGEWFDSQQCINKKVSNMSSTRTVVLGSRVDVDGILFVRTKCFAPLLAFAEFLKVWNKHN